MIKMFGFKMKLIFQENKSKIRNFNRVLFLSQLKSKKY